MSEPSTQKRRRLKRFALGLLGLVALSLLILWIFNLWMGTTLKAKLQKLRDTGAPVCIADLAPAPVPAEQNAAAHLQRMYPALKRFEKAMVVFEERTPLGKAYVQRTDKEEHALPTAEQAAAMQTILDDFSELFLAVDAMAACDQYASQLDFSLDFQPFLGQMLNGVRPIRSVARLLRWEMQVLTAQGKNDQAVETGIQLLTLTRLYDQEPAITNFLIGIACRGVAVHGLNQALQNGPIPEELQKKLDAELALHDDPQRFVAALRTERALSLDAMESWKNIGPLPIDWRVTFWQRDLLDWYDQQFSIAELPQQEWKKQMDQIDKSEFSFAAQLMFPAMHSAHEAFHRNLKELRSLR